MISLHILDINPLSDLIFMNVLSYSTSFLFILWIILCAVWSFLIWGSPIAYFCFCCVCFGCQIQKKKKKKNTSLPRSMSRILLTIFSSRSFMISGLITFFIVLFQTTDYSTVNYCCSSSSMPFHVLTNFFRTKPTAVVYRIQTYKLLKDFQPP